MILIGTSGFDYEDWRGVFYPEKLPRSEFLTYYSGRFEALELNFSYYRMPTAKQLASMVDRTGGQVAFSIKAHRTMTHERVASSSDYEQFAEALRPLRESGTLAAVLAQFPHSFQQVQENRTYLKNLADTLGPPLAVEFRRREWAADPILAWLKKNHVGFVCVDEPAIEGLMPKMAAATAPPGYVRFHGRNAEKWYQHDRAEQRYDYRYGAKELVGWIPRIKRIEHQVGKMMVFFNNHFQGKAVESAKILEQLLAMEAAGRLQNIPEDY